MESKFLIVLGQTKTSLRRSEQCEVGNERDPMEVTGKSDPFPTTIDEGVCIEGGQVVESIPALEVMWAAAPESAYHSEVDSGGFSVIMLKELASDA